MRWMLGRVRESRELVKRIKLTFLPKAVRTYACKRESRPVESDCTLNARVVGINRNENLALVASVSRISQRGAENNRQKEFLNDGEGETL